jgi:peptidoglycan hydrolase-like protein with peptidoglycan-binding domain
MAKKLIVALVGLTFLLGFVSLSLALDKKTITKVQEDLNTLGYYQGEPTGKMDDGTVKAVKAFQKDQKLKVDGKVGKKTLAALKKAIKAKQKEGQPAAEKKPAVQQKPAKQ